MENVRVRRAGYAFRQLYSQFLYRYKMLAPQTWPQWNGAPVDGVKVILSAVNISKEEMAFGETKIFIRNPRTVSALETILVVWDVNYMKPSLYMGEWVRGGGGIFHQSELNGASALHLF